MNNKQLSRAMRDAGIVVNKLREISEWSHEPGTQELLLKSAMRIATDVANDLYDLLKKNEKENS
jgi:hypothetical protein